MLIGMMLAAWRAGRMLRHGGQAFFRASGDLHAATTRERQLFTLCQRGALRLAAAAFSHALQRGRRIEPAVEALLAMGHTSGADTLLGFWLAQHII